MKNHAFLITAHHQPALLARMLRVLEADNHYFFIHINTRSGALSPFKEATKDIKNVTFVDRVCLYHGHISQIWATLIMIKAAIDTGVDFSYFHNITGQDYPLRSNRIFDAFFDSNTDSYLLYEDFQNLTIKSQNHHMNRVMQFRPKFNDNKIMKSLYYGFKIPNIIRMFIKRPPVDNFSFGSDFFSLHKNVIDYLLDYNQKHPDFLCRFMNTSSPSEIYYHTLLKPVVERFHIHTKEPLRYFSFVPHRPVSTKYRPFNLTEEDYEYVIDSRAFFCRKVHETESAKLLDMIDAQRENEYDINQHTKIY